MPGMWELPQLGVEVSAKSILRLRHSITVTDYAVQVLELDDPDKHTGEWIPAKRLPSLPLTGLARKILRRVEVL